MKVAIVGAGQIADAHIGEIAKIKSAEVVALCDLNESPLLALTEKYGIPHSDTDFSALMSSATPDVVHITTPPKSHLPLARVSMESGAHVYIEKPLTVTFEEAQELLEIAGKNNKQVCLGTNRVFAPAQKEVFTRIKDGEIGQLTHVDALFSYDLQGIFGKQVLSNPEHWIAKLPGQISQNNINHPLAAIVPFLSDNLSVRAWADDWSGNRIVYDELRVGIVDLTNNISASIVFSSNVKPAAFRVSYFGTSKAIFLNNMNNTYIIDSPNKIPGLLGNVLSIRRTSKQLSSQFWTRLNRFLLGRETFFGDMRVLFEEFYEAIGNNGPSPTPADEILRSSMIIDEIVSQIGRPDVG